MLQPKNPKGRRNALVSEILLESPLPMYLIGFNGLTTEKRRKSSFSLSDGLTL